MCVPSYEGTGRKDHRTAYDTVGLLVQYCTKVPAWPSIRCDDANIVVVVNNKYSYKLLCAE